MLLGRFQKLVDRLLVTGGKRKGSDRQEKQHRFMEFASAAVAARTSFGLTRTGLNSPAISSPYQVCLRVMLDGARLSFNIFWRSLGTQTLTHTHFGVAMGNSIQPPIARFEDFEVHLETGEVWKAGRPLKVQDQPFKVLAALLERPGQIVTREELRQLIWPENSFGDFDHAINLALTKLRGTLGDSADVPHLIETLPRRGYRFIAPLKVQSDPPPPARSSLRRSNKLLPLR